MAPASRLRLSIARMLLKNPKILLIDARVVSNSIESVVEKKLIMEVLCDAFKGRTVLIANHEYLFDSKHLRTHISSPFLQSVCIRSISVDTNSFL